MNIHCDLFRLQYGHDLRVLEKTRAAGHSIEARFKDLFKHLDLSQELGSAPSRDAVRPESGRCP
jgi:hypothetical protein